MPSFRFFASAFAVALSAVLACGGSQVPGASSAASADLTVAATLKAQSFVHGELTAGTSELAYAFNGSVGDFVAPDVWPTGDKASNSLMPTLTLLSPRGTNGHRSAIAHGSPRSDASHVAIDGFKLPQAGNYLVIVGEAATSGGGAFTLRFWTNASRAPRPESAQLDLASQPTSDTRNLVAAHSGSGALAGTAWSDSEIETVIASYLAEPDVITALSDAHELAFALAAAHSSGFATAAQLSRAGAGAAQVVGDAPTFASMDRPQQAFAMYWLGKLEQVVFQPTELQTAAFTPEQQKVSDKIDGLVASWPGAVEEPVRSIKAMMKDGQIYGYVADWACDQPDADGVLVFTWFSTDFFDANGRWLGEASQGATEVEDD